MIAMNREGLELIKSFESLKLKAYECPASGQGGNPRFWTIGWGTTIYPDGKAVRPNEVCTEAQAKEYFEYDIVNRYAPAVEKANIYLKLQNSNEFSSLVSFVYNVGTSGLASPNSIHRRIANGESYDRVIKEELPRWTRGGGVVLPGLVRRRQAELDLFFKEAEEDNEPGSSIPNIKYFLGQVNDSIKSYQKSLNSWLEKWNKPLLTADGIFGELSLFASNDFCKNNNEPICESGVTVATVNKVIAYYNRESKPSNPGYDTPDIKIYSRDQAGVPLSKNFLAGEFFCHCGQCKSQLISSELVANLQKLRDKMGTSLYLNSAYRCPTHNRNVGGVSNSRHTVGDAVDILTSVSGAPKLIANAEAVGFQGIGDGRYSGFVHVDMGDYGRWGY